MSGPPAKKAKTVNAFAEALSLLDDPADDPFLTSTDDEVTQGAEESIIPQLSPDSPEVNDDGKKKEKHVIQDGETSKKHKVTFDLSPEQDKPGPSTSKPKKEKKAPEQKEEREEPIVKPLSEEEELQRLKTLYVGLNFSNNF
uniref:Uncharacterized protein n=1 Tax=Panagrolaimus superbus TaxID=310955 RepID=A0A914YAN0_9BILA